MLVGYFLQCKVIDHVIIGKNGYFSMAEKGIIESLEKELTGVL